MPSVARPASPPPPPKAASAPAGAPSPAAPPATAGALKDALIAEIRGTKAFFYNTVVAQAQRIEVTDDRIAFAFLPTHRALREQFEQSRDWLESIAERVAGRRVSVAAIQASPSAGTEGNGEIVVAPPAPAGSTKRDLKAEAMSSTAVQAMLEVFPAEIRDVEEM